LLKIINFKITFNIISIKIYFFLLCFYNYVNINNLWEKNNNKASNKTNFLKVMGDKCKKNLNFHENILISHYFSF